jgi:hypothetical protein
MEEREKATDNETTLKKYVLVVSHVSKKVNEHGTENPERQAPSAVCSTIMALSHLIRSYINCMYGTTSIHDR